MSLPGQLTETQKRLMLAAAFLGWLCAGIELGLGPLAGRPAARALAYPEVSVTEKLSPPQEAEVAAWFARWISSFLLGAAVGGLTFGPLADRIGRVGAMALSVGCFSIFTGLSALAQTPEQMVVLRFLASLGIGGMWPAGVALIMEAWPAASRPWVAGAMGAAANVGMLATGLLGFVLKVTPETWRLATLCGAAPVVVALWIWRCVPESPQWLAEQQQPRTKGSSRLGEIFWPPLLSRTLIGICLGAIPLIGTWAGSQWLTPWTDKAGQNPAFTLAALSTGAVIGSALGGWFAQTIGRRTSYFLISLTSLVLTFATYRFLTPDALLFLPTVFVLGIVPTMFYGWLPLCLPELFPTRVRATGAGATFNCGRFATAGGVLMTATLMSYFQGDYSSVGQVMSSIYGLGMIVILFAPNVVPDEGPRVFAAKTAEA